MVKIVINNDNLEYYRDEVADFEKFKKLHTENIRRFRNICKQQFQDDDGELVFDYIIKYHQFDVVSFPDGLGEEAMGEKMRNIESKYPGCFI